VTRKTSRTVQPISGTLDAGGLRKEVRGAYVEVRPRNPRRSVVIRLPRYVWTEWLNIC